MRKEFVLGVDSGTQSTKSIIFDENGYPLAEGREPHTVVTPRPGWAEQRPQEWWEAFCNSINKALHEAKVSPDRIASVAITHQRCTLCAVDENGNAILPAQVWYDNRGIKQVKWIKEKFGADRYLEIAGRLPDTTWWAQKLMWVRDNEPHIFAKVHKFLTVHGYLVHKLIGEFKDSYAAPTGLLDMRKFVYSNKLLEAFGIPREKLCDLCAPGDVIGYVSKQASRQTGLPEDLPVVAGAGDQQAGGLGCGVAEPGMAYLNLGTSVVLGTISRKYVYHRNFFIREGSVPGTWNPEALLNGGYWMVTWFKENFAQAEVKGASSSELVPEEILDLEAMKVPPGSSGLVLQPYWLGVRQPYWDEHARGTVVGWTDTHTRAHLYRAIIEGIAYDIRLNLEGMEKSVGKIGDIRIHGGGARSDLSCQIVADVLGAAVNRVHTPEATALGAAILAAVGVRKFPNVERAVQAMSHVSGKFEPNSMNHKVYDSIYKEVYEELYPTVRKIIGRIDALIG